MGCREINTTKRACYQTALSDDQLLPWHEFLGNEVHNSILIRHTAGRRSNNIDCSDRCSSCSWCCITSVHVWQFVGTLQQLHVKSASQVSTVATSIQRGGICATMSG